MKQDPVMEQLRINTSKDMMDYVRRFEAVFEITLLTVTYYIIWRNIYFEMGIFPQYAGNGKYVLSLVYAVILFLTLRMNEGYQFGKLRYIDLIISQIVSILLCNAVTYLILSLIANRIISIIPILFLTGVDIFMILLICYFYTILYARTHRPRRILMVYGKKGAVILEKKLGLRPDKYQVEEMISADLGLDAICKEMAGFDAVVLNDITAKLRNDILKYCYRIGKRAYVVPKISDVIIRGAEEIALFDTPLLLVRSRGISNVQSMIKRIFDILLCTIALIPSLPILGIVALAIKIDDGGSVFFRQERVTKGGKRFMILKFRSMTEEASNSGEVRPTENNDQRVTRVGTFIRRTRLDELPQIFNILKGEMSIVGPRPERVEHVIKYLEEIPEFAFRYKVPAGLTGYAQVYGKYNTSAYDKLRLDLTYIEKYSILMDLKLITMTIRALLDKSSTEGFEAAADPKEKTAEVLPEEYDKKESSRKNPSEQGES